MKTYLGFDSLTLEEIEGYLDNEWNDLLPKYQEQCIKWLIKEIKRLRNLTSKSSRQAEAWRCRACGQIVDEVPCFNCGSNAAACC